MLRIDLNADVGESFGVWSLGQDPVLIPLVTSVNIACGFHAGDPGVMRETVALAVANHVAIGAHPGFADLAGFGRREMHIPAREVEDAVAYQIGALAGIAAAQGAVLRHVKPHGALYNMAARDPSLADAIARAVRAVDASLALFGLAGSALLEAGARAGLRTASEVFADRGYQADGRLTPRSTAGAVLDDPAAIAQRALRMVREGTVAAGDGTVVQVKADTICVHGDTPAAVDSARHIRRALADAGVTLTAF